MNRRNQVAFRRSQKAVDLRRNPKVAVLAESGEAHAELRGLMIRGHAEVVDDLDVCMRTLLAVQPRYFGPTDPSVREVLRQQAQKRVAIRIQPERVASWDHSKLRGAY